MKEITVVGGPASLNLAKRIAKKLNLPYKSFSLKIFPDGESKVRLEEVPNTKGVILVQSTYPPVDRHWMQLFFMLSFLTEKAYDIILVVPYFGYSRQDKEFLKGEAISLKVIADLLSNFWIKEMITLDFHNPKALSYFKFPAYNLSTVPLLAEYAKKNFQLIDSLCVSPDLGGSSRVKEFSKILEIPYLSLEKSRDKITGEISLKDAEIQVSNKTIFIVDDIISTGKSIVKATKFLKERGASKVYALISHIISSNALKIIKESDIDELIGTNTIPNRISKVDVSEIVSSYIEKKW